MAIGDGLRIVLTFDRNIVSDLTGEENEFTVRITGYSFYPGGQAALIDRAVQRVIPYWTLDNEEIPLESGSCTHAVVNNGKLMLARNAE